MVTRLRIESEGATAREVEEFLSALAETLDRLIGWDASRGECVIERQQSEPEGAATAWAGRLILHPNVANDSRQVAFFGDLGVDPITLTAGITLNPGSFLSGTIGATGVNG